MKKKRSQRLNVVLDLARRKREMADRYMAESRQRVVQGEQQKKQLEIYLQEYQEQFTRAGQSGLTAVAMQTHRFFIAKIQDALLKQEETLKQARYQLEMVTEHWRQAYRHFQAIEKLQDKALAAEQQLQDKRLQSEIDERSQLQRARGI